MRREMRARAVSPSPTMYFGYSAGSGFPNTVVVNGVELQFCTKPDFGFGHLRQLIEGVIALPLGFRTWSHPPASTNRNFSERLGTAPLYT